MCECVTSFHAKLLPNPHSTQGGTKTISRQHLLVKRHTCIMSCNRASIGTSRGLGGAAEGCPTSRPWRSASVRIARSTSTKLGIGGASVWIGSDGGARVLSNTNLAPSFTPCLLKGSCRFKIRRPLKIYSSQGYILGHWIYECASCRLVVENWATWPRQTDTNTSYPPNKKEQKDMNYYKLTNRTLLFAPGMFAKQCRIDWNTRRS